MKYQVQQRNDVEDAARFLPSGTESPLLKIIFGLVDMPDFSISEADLVIQYSPVFESSNEEYTSPQIIEKFSRPVTVTEFEQYAYILEAATLLLNESVHCNSTVELESVARLYDAAALPRYTSHIHAVSEILVVLLQPGNQDLSFVSTRFTDALCEASAETEPLDWYTAVNLVFCAALERHRPGYVS